GLVGDAAAVEPVDAAGLEVGQVVGVVDDAHQVGLAEADRDRHPRARGGERGGHDQPPSGAPASGLWPCTRRARISTVWGAEPFSPRNVRHWTRYRPRGGPIT